MRPRAPELKGASISDLIESVAALVKQTEARPGIPQANVESIYDPFFTTKQNGTGLGLAVGYQIMEQHRSELVLEANWLLRRAFCYAAARGSF